jgi:Flp pilus assembly protein TadD
MMGNIWAKHRREPDTALTYLKEALLLRPDDHIAATNIASQLMELKRPEEARGYLEQAIRSACRAATMVITNPGMQQVRQGPEGLQRMRPTTARPGRVHVSGVYVRAS